MWLLWYSICLLTGEALYERWQEHKRSFLVCDERTHHFTAISRYQLTKWCRQVSYCGRHCACSDYPNEMPSIRSRAAVHETLSCLVSPEMHWIKFVWPDTINSITEFVQWNTFCKKVKWQKPRNSLKLFSGKFLLFTPIVIIKKSANIKVIDSNIECWIVR